MNSPLFLLGQIVTQRPLSTALILLGISVVLSACGGGGSSATSPAPQYLVGTLIDSPVVGATYQTATISGKTSSSGGFQYLPNETVSFSIGDIQLGSAKGAGTITLLDLGGGGSATDPTTTNLARFLQTIDNNSNSSDGIQIPSSAAVAANGLRINFGQSITAFASDASVANAVRAITQQSDSGEKSLIDAADAQTHLRAVMSMLAGDACGGKTPCVRISGLHSRQFAGTNSNEITETTPNAGNSSNSHNYILMGASVDGIIRFSADFQSTGSSLKMLARLAVRRDDSGTFVPFGPSTPISGQNISFTVNPEVDLIAIQGVNIHNAIDILVYAGIDNNSNGILDEASSTSEVTDTSKWIIRAISRTRYNEQLNSLKTNVNLANVAFPIAASFATAFLQGTDIAGASAAPASLQSMESKWADIIGKAGQPAYTESTPGILNGAIEPYPLSHKVGINYNTSSSEVRSYNFPDKSDFSKKISESQIFKDFVLAALLSKVNASLSSDLGALTAEVRVAARYDSLLSEFGLSIGTGYFRAKYSGTMVCTAGRVSIQSGALTAELYDIYDWNYSSGGNAAGWAQLLSQALNDAFKGFASVQAGFGTLGNGGQIFQILATLPVDEKSISGALKDVQCTSPLDPTPSFLNLDRCNSKSLAGNWYAYDGSGIYIFLESGSGGWFPTTGKNWPFRYNLYVSSNSVCIIHFEDLSALSDLLSYSTWIGIGACDLKIYRTQTDVFGYPIKTNGAPIKFFGNC